MNESKIGQFITIEGIEGVGKTTAQEWVVQAITDAGFSVKTTREPGGTPMAESIRRVLLHSYDEDVEPDTELLMMFAARSQHIARVVKPNLQQGTWVVSDRFTDASYAYQGAGRGIPFSRIAELEQWVQGELRPDLTLLLDAPLDVALGRIMKRGGLDRIEAEDQAFFERIRQGYLARAKEEPSRFVMIDASQAVADVQAQIKTALTQFMQQVKAPA
jgi:dTMP kinase